MALVQREHVPRPVAVGENDDRCVGEADAEIAVVVDHPHCGRYVISSERDEIVGATRHLSQKRELRIDSGLAPEQVIELGEHERREEQRRHGAFESASRGFVGALVAHERGEQAARVEQDQRVPKPSSASSTRSARSGATTCSSSGSLGLGGETARVYPSIAARISSASDTSRSRATRSSS